jgi:hypothetical protein
MTSPYKDHLTPEALDKMDIKNPTSFHILTDMVENLIRDTGSLYARSVTKDAQKAIAKKLCQAGYRYSAIKAGLDRIAETSPAFPSYSDIVASVRLFTPSDSIQTKNDVEYQKEQERFEKYKAEMVKLMGEDGLARFFKWWKENVPPFQISKEYEALYLKCAIFDWVDAGLSTNREKISQVGKMKFKKLENSP